VLSSLVLRACWGLLFLAAHAQFSHNLAWAKDNDYSLSKTTCGTMLSEARTQGKVAVSSSGLGWVSPKCRRRNGNGGVNADISRPEQQGKSGAWSRGCRYLPWRFGKPK